MSNNDMDDISAQDNLSEEMDMAQDFDDSDEFAEFDAPQKGQSKSLGDIFRDNPLLKIGVIGAGVVIVAASMFMFGGSSSDIQSKVGPALKESVAPGQEDTEAYREAIEEVNQQRYDAALRTGQSTMPIPTSAPEVNVAQTQIEQPSVGLTDPLDSWRTSAQQAAASDIPDPLAVQEPPVTQYPVAQTQPTVLGPDAAAVDALAQAMGQQMQQIIDKHNIRGMQNITVTAPDYLGAQNTNGGQQMGNAVAGQPNGGNSTPEEVEIIIPAGTIVYAQTLTEANTDAPGPVLARLSSGPLRGARIIGTFSNTENYITLNFNTVIVNGVSQSINAVALDPQTTLPAVATEVDHRYWTRFVLPAAARFIEGMGDAVSQRESTTVSVSGDTVTSSKPDLNTREELAAGLAESTQTLADALDDEADATQPLIKVHAGTAVGILFMQPVTRQD